MTERCDLTVITPMYNEAERIQDNVRAILAALDALDVSWEYILVDDGSNDDSLAKAQAVLADRADCRVIHYHPNRGRGYALRQGFAAARGRYVLTTESDLSWGAEIIAKLLDTLRTTDADIVIASTYLPGGGLENVPSHRWLLSKLGNRFMRWAFGGQLTMLSGMTRGYRGEAVRALYLEENRKEIHLEIVAKAQALNMRIVEIPATIRWEPPRPGQPRRRSWGVFRFIIPHLLASFHRASVRMLFWAAILTGTVGGLFIIVGTIHKLFRILPYPLPNLVIYGLIMAVMALLFGMLALLSVQLKFVYRSLVHLQSQLKQLRESAAGPAAPGDEGE